MSDKKRQLGNRFEEYTQQPDAQRDTTDTFGSREYDDDVFAALDAADVSRETIAIMEIRADITQPRRIVPRSVRGAWDGSPSGVPALLDQWAQAVGLKESDIKKMLTGNASTHERAGESDSLDALLGVLELASQIADVGLQQPIGVISIAKGYQIIFGERRWMAFHALAHWHSDRYTEIPARVANVTPWELAKIQAAENFQRVELNAIEKARQFAKLLIISRQDEHDYDPWQNLVVDGGCDRPYYAQVSNGNIHRIPRGMGEQFESALNVSTGQMRQYRMLLSLTGDHDTDNALWMMGDEGDWPENFMREVSQKMTLEQIQHVLYRYGRNGIITGEVVSDVENALRDYLATVKETEPEPPAPPVEPAFVVGDTVLYNGTVPAKVIGYEVDMLILLLWNGRRKKAYADDLIKMPVSHYDAMVATLKRNQQADSTPPAQTDEGSDNSHSPARQDAYSKEHLQALYLNKRVTLTSGKQGVVVHVNAALNSVQVRLDDGASPLVSIQQIASVSDAPATPPETKKTEPPASDWLGKAVIVEDGGVIKRGVVNRANGEMLGIELSDGTRIESHSDYVTLDLSPRSERLSDYYDKRESAPVTSTPPPVKQSTTGGALLSHQWILKIKYVRELANLLGNEDDYQVISRAMLVTQDDPEAMKKIESLYNSTSRVLEQFFGEFSEMLNDITDNN
ncbi:MAG: ParB/RepB/Spo0J family partition protein [Anaerolineae bacterium]